ncbi:MAG: PQQ-binding-like beta-propeller repeat protein [Myxococcales bacterium]|nr:PQQ-binding-like beta-propeller repeat protein [Myxococcales bacterium]MCB9690951.1 PQQ-binding-like beta-propeller repeat protein [Alphaproteobacteria bacterium]
MTIPPMQPASLRALHPLSNLAPPAERIAVLDGQVAVASSDGSLWIGDRRLSAHKGPLVALQVHGDGFLTAGRDGFAAIWDTDGRPLFVRRHPTGPICAATLTDGTLVIADDHGLVFAIDLHTGQSEWIGDLKSPITALSGSLGVVTMGTAHGTVHWDGFTEKRHRGKVLAIYPAGSCEVLSIGEDGRVRLGSELLLRVSEGVTACSLYQGRLLLAMDRDVQEWDLRSLTLLRSTTSTAGPVQDVALDASGAWVLIDGEGAPRHWS